MLESSLDSLYKILKYKQIQGQFLVAVVIIYTSVCVRVNLLKQSKDQKSLEWTQFLQFLLSDGSLLGYFQTPERIIIVCGNS